MLVVAVDCQYAQSCRLLVHSKLSGLYGRENHSQPQGLSVSFMPNKYMGYERKSYLTSCIVGRLIFLPVLVLTRRGRNTGKNRYW